MTTMLTNPPFDLGSSSKLEGESNLSHGLSCLSSPIQRLVKVVGEDRKGMVVVRVSHKWRSRQLLHGRLLQSVHVANFLIKSIDSTINEKIHKLSSLLCCS
ncbi:hypothetical protein RIF29_22076 [Crotalaria pallida]|uniref:Uncharacterized protein n=1 Tax=Crotalaria pallida TaxID=3830 RepID=A0AAN9IE36_CROPI